ncbi:DUF805 domain-containing protein [Frigoribacterium sp. PvP032]|uniref:DUF805 domain-containing protein n=1 Tax=Frigoribacterium sp. PvP032 TaxID=2806589 RepID=UPI001AE7F562|nr:DUF805 domain-containing protein [Frigoribacterium sp. PvP032]MBP1191776.1 uncharacterized membrane protein YhaH (DUF805 family) [Frigoribacterium sp. PvP032]
MQGAVRRSPSTERSALGSVEWATAPTGPPHDHDGHGRPTRGGARIRLPDSLTVTGPVLGARPWIACARAVTRLTTTGRASRSEFWWTWLLQTVVAAVLLLAVPLLQGRTRDLQLPSGPFGPGLLGTVPLFSWNDTSGAPAGGASVVIWTVWSLLTLAPMVALAIRRLHDADHSAWWALGAVLVPVLSFVVLVLLAQRSKPVGVRFDRAHLDRPGADRPGAEGALAPSEGGR